MLGLILGLHVVGAILIGLVLTCALIAVYLNKPAQFSKYASAIGLNFVLQLITGSLLAIMTTHSVSLAHFCSNIAIYVVATIAVEGVLLWKMQRQFPFTIFLPSMGVGLLAVVATIALKF